MAVIALEEERENSLWDKLKVKAFSRDEKEVYFKSYPQIKEEGFIYIPSRIDGFSLWVLDTPPSKFTLSKLDKKSPRDFLELYFFNTEFSGIPFESNTFHRWNPELNSERAWNPETLCVTKFVDWEKTYLFALQSAKEYIKTGKASALAINSNYIASFFPEGVDLSVLRPPFKEPFSLEKVISLAPNEIKNIIEEEHEYFN